MKIIKLIIYIVIYIGSSNFIFSQTEWAPIGAKWYYNMNHTNGVCGYIESVGDTIIDDKSCRIMEIEYCYYDYEWEKQFLHQKGDSIFYYDAGNFYLLYDFSAKIGDTIIVRKDEFLPDYPFLLNPDPDDDCYCNCFSYIITGIDSIEINGHVLKQQYITIDKGCSWGMYNNVNIEKLGNLNYFYGKGISIDLGYIKGLLRCYSDHEINYINPEYSFSCDFDHTVNTNFPYLKKEIKIYPNPVKDYIEIECEGLIQSMCIYSISGQLIESVALSKDISIINVNSLEGGFYILELMVNESKYYFNFIKID